tara:strand:- start:194 stop:607 length:414 start_codon:yes stop_codon:yes gene_type:complete
MAAIGGNIGKMIYNVLSNDSTLISYIGSANKIQPIVMYNESPSAGIFYEVLNVENVNTKTIIAADLTIVIFQVECFSEGYIKLIDISSRIQFLLDKLQKGTYGGFKIQSNILTGMSEDYNKKNSLYYRQLTFQCRAL